MPTPQSSCIRMVQLVSVSWDKGDVGNKGGENKQKDSSVGKLYKGAVIILVLLTIGRKSYYYRLFNDSNVFTCNIHLRL